MRKSRMTGLMPIRMWAATGNTAFYKNLYIVGTTQPHYGFGRLVTPASLMLAQMVKLQDQMELPIGLVINEAGAKLPDSHPVDSISAI